MKLVAPDDRNRKEEHRMRTNRTERYYVRVAANRREGGPHYPEAARDLAAVRQAEITPRLF